MYQGKKKAVTFSYDDGVTQDIRLIALFNKYGLKATFNLNSELLGSFGTLERDGQSITHNKNICTCINYFLHIVFINTTVNLYFYF